jgi:NhaC family Na+:H+ antiporter
LTDLDRIYDFNIWMLLPALLVFAGAYKGLHPVVLMISSCLLAVVVGWLSNGFSGTDGAQSLFNGFNITMTGEAGISENLLVLLNRGGMVEMLSGAVLFAILAIGFGSFLEAYGALDRIMRGLLTMVKSTYQLIIAAFFTGGLLNAISGNGAFSILTTGKMYVPSFNTYRLSRTLLSRSMENSMTLLESLLPWHVTALYMYKIFGVHPLEYIPFAFFNIAGILLYFWFAWRQSRPERLLPPEEVSEQ